MNGLRTAKTKIVTCTHCGGPNEVAARAMSVFCAHCRKRLILENYIIKSYQAVKGYATCGDVSVEKRGRVAAPIQSNSLTVKGKVHGKVEARGKVEVTSTGSLEGSLRATSLLVVKGASFDGYCEIRPSTEPAAEPKPAELHPQSSTEPRQVNGVKQVSTKQAVSRRTASTVKKVSRPSVDMPNVEPTVEAPPPKKVAVKKTPAKKVTAKKPIAKKVSSQKASAKKAVTKKSPIKKITTRSASKSPAASAVVTPAKSKPSKVKAISTRRRKAATPGK